MTDPTFEEVYHTYKKQVYNLALYYVHQSEDAQEITQDVFVSIYQSLSTFKKESQLSTWIYRITINKSLDFIKAGKRKKRLSTLASFFTRSENQLPIDIPDFEHPGIVMEQKENIALIFRGIHMLPSQQKTALMLNKIEGQSHAEIAVIMEISAKAVESLVQRAKTNLIKWLEQTEGK